MLTFALKMQWKNKQTKKMGKWNRSEKYLLDLWFLSFPFHFLNKIFQTQRNKENLPICFLFPKL